MPVPSAIATAIGDALAPAAGLPPGVAVLALLAGGLLLLAGDEDRSRRATARHALALGLGGLASGGLATGLAVLVASLAAGR
ncbi:MAG: hypothetical protein IT561_00985 [Alphaproteobacteria bacterium]|nr:hypothetical protein [Alphaproteobacteria bacterium]